MPIMCNNQMLTEKCAVFGVYGTGLDAARLSFYGLCALQHRGQESSGIASSDGSTIYRHAENGLVSAVFREADLDRLPGHIAIGHNRYSTSGGTSDHHCQPFIDPAHTFAFAHNGNLPDYHQLKDFLRERGAHTAGLNDSGMMAAAIRCYLDDGLSLEDAIAAAFPLFTGVFSAVAMTPEKLVAFRDTCGIRPLSIGALEDGYAVASETCAFDTIGATLIRDVKPGELITIDKNGLSSRQIAPGTQKLDIFELVYFARPDSIIMGKCVNEIRTNFGYELAMEYPISADVIIPVPDSAVPAALGYAKKSGIPFEMGLIKNRYIHRTFIRPSAELRERDLKMKLNPIIGAIKGRRVILVDDSIVRGTTMRKVVSMLFEAGAKEVHLMISSPPVRYPDFYGINTPSQSELIAAQMTVTETRNYVGATSLNYLSYDGMIRATGMPEKMFSTSCFSGIYPVSIGARADEVTDILPGVPLPTTPLTPLAHPA